MSLLMRATEITKRPVVTLEGEDVAQIKDIVYADSGGRVGGFTLNGRGFLSATLKTALAWEAVVGLGPDAVMIRDEGALTDRDAFITEIVGTSGGSGGDSAGGYAWGQAVGGVLHDVDGRGSGSGRTAVVIAGEAS